MHVTDGKCEPLQEMVRPVRQMAQPYFSHEERSAQIQIHSPWGSIDGLVEALWSYDRPRKSRGRILIDHHQDPVVPDQPGSADSHETVSDQKRGGDIFVSGEKVGLQ